MSPTLKDIANIAGVDIGTVSHVLNHHPKASHLRSETRATIERIAQELGYRRNEHAAAIASKGNSHVVAFISGDMGSVEYTGRIQNGVFDEASARGYAVTVYHITREHEEDIVNRLLGWRTAGVVFHIPALSSASRIIDVLRLQHIPFGTANLSNSSSIGVTTDDTDGVYRAVAFLRQQGRKKLFFASGEFPQATEQEYLLRRKEGYRRGMAKWFPSQPPRFLSLPADASQAVYQQALDGIIRLIATGGCDGILCDSDITAMGILLQASAQGVNIPRDCALVGFGNLELAERLKPSLTTISQNFELMGQMTARAVIDAIEHRSPQDAQSQPLLPVQLLKREST